jgi:hypothetical protein
LNYNTPFSCSTRKRTAQNNVVGGVSKQISTDGILRAVAAQEETFFEGAISVRKIRFAGLSMPKRKPAKIADCAETRSEVS